MEQLDSEEVESDDEVGHATSVERQIPTDSTVHADDADDADDGWDEQEVVEPGHTAEAEE